MHHTKVCIGALSVKTAEPADQSAFAKHLEVEIVGLCFSRTAYEKGLKFYFYYSRPVFFVL